MNNKKAKEKLVRIFGPVDFSEELHFRSKGQLHKMEELTYHHIIPVSEGGKTTLGNGALLTRANHDWFHKQNKHKQKEINKAFQEYKECNIVYCDELDLDYKIVAVELNLGRKRTKGRDDR